MLVKVCGLRDNINEVLALNPDFAGLIFYPKSLRYIAKSQDVDLKQKLNGINKVGVFVNEDYNTIVTLIDDYNLDYVQLHGNESIDFCKQMRKIIPVIKAFGVSSAADVECVNQYAEYVDYLLLDTKTASYGGSGIKFDWNILSTVKIGQKFLLSGGISLDDIPTIKNLNINNLVGVDLNSKFEISPTLKNIVQLTQAINILRK